MPTTDPCGLEDLAYTLGRFAKLPPAAATARNHHPKLPPAAATARNHNAIRPRPQRIDERRSDLFFVLAYWAPASSWARLSLPICHRP